jgi:cysteine desulfurase NifS/selenium donor protein
MKPIYLDYNATTPIDKEVKEAMLPYLNEHFGNPSSSHWYGIQTKKAIQKARKQVASILYCNAEEIIFTSGGTESNNFAIKGFAFANRKKGNHIITSTIEHPAVIEVCKYLEKNGFDVSYISVDKYGIVNLPELEKAITSQTILITIMHANNEVGTIQPIKEISKIARKNKIIFHTDAAQSVGKIPTDVNEFGVDLLSIAGHKLYAPKGIGALYIRQGIQLEKFMHGANHEQDQRAGTENVLEIVGLGKACEIAKRDLEKNMTQMKKMRDRLHEGLIQNLEDIKLNGHPTKRLPNTLSLSFPNLEADGILSELEEIAASAGAACHSDSIELSPVLTAMNVPKELAMGTIRFSTGKRTTEDEIDKAIDAVTKVIEQMRFPSEKTHLQESKKVKLTHFTAGLGCACKLRPQALEKVLSSLNPILDPNVIVGTNTADDAAVYKLDENTAIVQTVDFFTPIVDDPYQFGAIAVANALSDVYAMGAKPLFALNIVGFPSNRLPMEVLKQILLGAEDKAKEAEVSIIGGHTIDDNEPKYGLVVLGVVHPDKILTNSDAKPGDIIILTKPIGLGIISTAMKKGLVEEKTIKKAIQIMSTLNKKAAEIMKEFPVNSCTDVTGFGLLGHLKEMTESSKVNAKIYLKEIPTINEAWELIVENVVPGGTLNNLDYVKEIVEWDNNISRAAKIILCDAQTSGGLLIAIPDEYADALLKRLHQNNMNDSSIIGKFTKKGKGKIFVKKSYQE